MGDYFNRLIPRSTPGSGRAPQAPHGASRSSPDGARTGPLTPSGGSDRRSAGGTGETGGPGERWNGTGGQGSSPPHSGDDHVPFFDENDPGTARHGTIPFSGFAARSAPGPASGPGSDGPDHPNLPPAFHRHRTGPASGSPGSSGWRGTPPEGHGTTGSPSGPSPVTDPSGMRFTDSLQARARSPDTTDSAGFHPEGSRGPGSSSGPSSGPSRHSSFPSRSGHPDAPERDGTGFLDTLASGARDGSLPPEARPDPQQGRDGYRGTSRDRTPDPDALAPWPQGPGIPRGPRGQGSAGWQAPSPRPPHPDPGIGEFRLTIGSIQVVVEGEDPATAPSPAPRNRRGRQGAGRGPQVDAPGETGRRLARHYLR